MERRKLIKSSLIIGMYPLFSARELAKTCPLTTDDIQGPYYTPNAPIKQKLSPEGAEGTPLFITGTVFAKDCETPIPSSKLDVWHADSQGVYDEQGYNYRGVFHADAMGNYAMETILPGKYLNGSYYRPRHIHFKIQGGGSNELTTQLYFEGDTSIPDDQWASDPLAEHRIVALAEDEQANLHGVFDIHLNAEPDDVTTDLHDIRHEQGKNRIASISASPGTGTVDVKFYLSQISKTVHVIVYNIYGQRIRYQSIKYVNPGQNRVSFNLSNSYGLSLPHGIYIMQLIVNEQLADAKRFYIN